MINQENAYLLVLVPCIIALGAAGLFVWGFWLDIRQLHKKGGRAKKMTYIGLACILVGIVGIGIVSSQVYSNKGKTDVYTEGQFSMLTDMGIENTIRNWLDTPLYAVQRKEAENTYFQFDIKDKSGRNITIFRNKDAPSSILFATYLSFAPNQLETVRTKKNEITRKLSLELAKLGIGYHFEDNNERVFLETKMVINDSLTEEKFSDSIILIIRGLVITQESVLEIVPDLPNSSP